MALKYFQAVILILINSVFSEDVKSTADLSTTPKAILDSKRRNDLVDEAFSEQKDILLDMLEAKLKEVRNKKQKKTDPVGLGNAIAEPIKCDGLPNDVDLNIEGNGIIAVGETDILLKFGESGQNVLNLNATGISNIGKTYVNLNTGGGYPNIPGINNLLSGPIFSRTPCRKQTKTKHHDSLNAIKLNDGILRKGLELSNSSVAKSFATNNTLYNEGNKKTKSVYVDISTSSKPTSALLKTSR